MYICKAYCYYPDDVHIKKILKPVIYACQVDQFDYTHARTFGYTSISRFMVGHNAQRDTKATWRGTHDDIPFKTLQLKLFKNNYDSVSTSTSTSEEFSGIRMDFAG